MWPLEIWIGGIMLVSLTIYALSGGADFGGGVWDLFAVGPRARAQRETIAQAIGPIWEANHVWLILVVVLLFVAFPVAFAAISTALHIPLTVMLVGIVLRGSAFVFRAYDDPSHEAQRRWSLVFAIASTVTPVMLGITLGAVISGDIRVDTATGRVSTDFLSAWLAPFPFALGFFTLTLFAFLAAVYLTLETDHPDLQEDFRHRALAAAVGVGVMAWISLLLAGREAPLLQAGLTGQWWSWPFQGVTGTIALGAIWALWARRFQLARTLAAAQVILIVWGWGLAQFPYVVVPDLTFTNAAAPDSVLQPLLIALLSGVVILVPSFAYLYTVFKRKPRSDQPDEALKRSGG